MMPHRIDPVVNIQIYNPDYPLKKPINKNPHVGIINASIVFDRDGWRCQLCGKKLKAKNRGSVADDAPEVDHIISRYNGGEHSYKNTQCACRKCNRAKGSRSKGQLRLFG